MGRVNWVKTTGPQPASEDAIILLSKTKKSCIHISSNEILTTKRELALAFYLSHLCSDTNLQYEWTWLGYL